MAVVGEKMQLQRDLMGCQRTGKHQRVLHGNGRVLHRMPDEEGRQTVADLVFQAHCGAQVGVIAAEVDNGAVVAVFPAVMTG